MPESEKQFRTSFGILSVMLLALMTPVGVNRIYIETDY